MYSKIPMPKIEWKEENMRYTLCFFPLVGLVTGAAMYGLWLVRARIGVFIPFEVFALVGTVLPVLLTGGIHLDGFLDTMDALHSYQSREKKLEILKDPHIGAFASISLACETLLYAAGLFFLLEEKQLLMLGIGFLLSRTLSAFSLVTVKSAKKDGLLYTFASAAHKRTVLAALSLWLFLAAAAAYLLYGILGVLCVAASLTVFFYYEWMACKQFGGLTGDLAGWFVTVYELVFVWLVGIMGYIWNW